MDRDATGGGDLRVAVRGVRMRLGRTQGADEATNGWSTRAEAFDLEARDGTALAASYRAAIDAVLDAARRDADAGVAPPVAALVTECVLHGAGGMDLIDPLFQRVLVRACKDRGIPVVFDEVFAGIWRLGAEGAWELLGETPDVSCYAKLFTGGLAPLAATVATEEVFDAFRGPTKQHGLLHGHSYTAYPAGCAVAAEAMRMYRDPESNPNLVSSGGVGDGASVAGSLDDVGDDVDRPGTGTGATLRLRELWDERAVREISMLPNVKGVVAIGCVLAVEVDDGAGGGYSSSATKDIVLKLRAHSIQARPLGNVLYLMCAPTTPPERCSELLEAVTRELQAAAMGDDDDGW